MAMNQHLVSLLWNGRYYGWSVGIRQFGVNRSLSAQVFPQAHYGSKQLPLHIVPFLYILSYLQHRNRHQIITKHDAIPHSSNAHTIPTSTNRTLTHLPSPPHPTSHCTLLPTPSAPPRPPAQSPHHAPRSSHPAPTSPRRTKRRLHPCPRCADGALPLAWHRPAHALCGDAAVVDGRTGRRRRACYCREAAEKARGGERLSTRTARVLALSVTAVWRKHSAASSA